MTDDYKVALGYAANTKQLNPDHIDRKVIMPIVFHESGGRVDDQYLKQKLSDGGVGIGRGVAQFEGTLGQDMGFRAAVTRAKNFLGNNGNGVPTWLSSLGEGDDATALTVPQQKALLVYDLLEKPNRKIGGKEIPIPADLSLVVNGDVSVLDFWLNYHWAGPVATAADRAERDKRVEVFKGNQAAYLRQFPEPLPTGPTPRPELPAGQEQQEELNIFEKYLKGIQNTFKNYFAEAPSQQTEEKELS